MSLSDLRVFARNCVWLAQDLKDALWPSQLVDALREADFARNALNDFEAEHDGLDGYELPDFPGPFPDPLASGVASATEAPSSVDASVRSAGEAPPPDASPAEHSNEPSVHEMLNLTFCALTASGAIAAFDPSDRAIWSDIARELRDFADVLDPITEDAQPK